MVFIPPEIADPSYLHRDFSFAPTLLVFIICCKCSVTPLCSLEQKLYIILFPQVSLEETHCLLWQHKQVSRKLDRENQHQTIDRQRKFYNYSALGILRQNEDRRPVVWQHLDVDPERPMLPIKEFRGRRTGSTFTWTYAPTTARLGSKLQKLIFNRKFFF